MIHDFRERLAFSESAGDEAFWESVYRNAFRNFAGHMPVHGDLKVQRMGVDRVVLLDNGRSLYIDEKKREKVYPDILLEYVSVDTTGAPGWMEKDLAIDYMAYAFMPIKKVYLWPWPTLRRAWNRYKAAWLKTYPTVTAQNNGYRTLSVAVPISTLGHAVLACTVVIVSQP